MPSYKCGYSFCPVLQNWGWGVYIWRTGQGIVCWRTFPTRVFLPHWPEEAQVFDVHVWIPGSSVSSEKREDHGEQQGITNCMRERRREKFVICFRNKGKALFFGGQHFSCFYCERLLMRRSQVFWHLWWCCDCLEAKSLSVKCSGASDCLYHKFCGWSWARHWCWKPIFRFIFNFWGKWNVGQGPSVLRASLPHFVFHHYLLTMLARW